MYQPAYVDLRVSTKSVSEKVDRQRNITVSGGSDQKAKPPKPYQGTQRMRRTTQARRVLALNVERGEVSKEKGGFPFGN